MCVIGFGRYRFRRSFGNVKSQFRGARFDTYPLFSGILDDYPNAAAAYSLRALSSAWLAGDVVEVRRSSDSTTQSFTAGQVTDGTLEAFCGVGDGFVSKWYDQSGNANNATQSTTTAQPKIVDAGSLVTGGINFDGVDDYLDFGSILSSQPFSVLSAYTTSVDASPIIGGGAGINQFTGRRSSGEWIAFAGIALAGGTHPDTETIGTFIYNGGSSAIFGDGASIVSGNAGTTFNVSRIGNNNTIAFFEGQANEIIIYPSDQSANRVGIETNINDFYNIY